jgi:glycine/D-amino acid oxidase-like deaminating enzyme
MARRRWPTPWFHGRRCRTGGLGGGAVGWASPGLQVEPSQGGRHERDRRDALRTSDLEFRRRLGELSKELESDFEFVQSGGLIVAEDVRKAEPHLSPRILGATYCPLDGYANPMALALALARGARALGAEVRTQTEVVGLAVSEGRVRGVRTRTGALAGDVVVNAAGVWSPDVARLAGLDVSVVPRKGQLIVSEALPPLFSTCPGRDGGRESRYGGGTIPHNVGQDRPRPDRAPQLPRRAPRRHPRPAGRRCRRGRHPVHDAGRPRPVPRPVEPAPAAVRAQSLRWQHRGRLRLRLRGRPLRRPARPPRRLRRRPGAARPVRGERWRGSRPRRATTSA